MGRTKYDDWLQTKHRLGSRREIINALKDRGLTLKELIQRTGLSKPSVYKNLGHLMEKGLVRKVSMKGEKEFQGDKRALRRKAWDEYRLTKKGVKVHESTSIRRDNLSL